MMLMGSKTPVDTTGCPFSLDVTDNGSTGTWSKDKLPVILKKVASLDDTSERKIEGTVEIPFWAQTATDRFAGVYAKTDAGICMTKMQVIKKRSGKVAQEIAFGDDCTAGTLMTPIYMNVETWVDKGKDVISVHFNSGGAGSEVDYVLNRTTGKYRKKK